MIHPTDVSGALPMPPCPHGFAARTYDRCPGGPHAADPVIWHRVDLAERLAMILVTGATGTTGRPADVEVVEGDPARPDTIAPYLEGVTALFLHPRAVGLAAGELLALARK